MAVRRSFAHTVEEADGDKSAVEAATTPLIEASVTPEPLAPPSWEDDDASLLPEVLRNHNIPAALSQRLLKLATAPQHVPRAVDRLAIALGAHFDFAALADVRQTPVLLCGLPGAGVSTLAAKLAAPFADHEILVISAGVQDAEKTARLADELEALDLPLTIAPDAAALQRAVAGAAGRQVVIDAGGQSPLGRHHLGEWTKAAGATAMLAMSATMPAREATALAEAASAGGIARTIITCLDLARYLGPVLTAVDTAKLALVGASVTPHFAFGLRVLTPQNLARRMIAAALHAERWRVMPL